MGYTTVIEMMERRLKCNLSYTYGMTKINDGRARDAF